MGADGQQPSGLAQGVVGSGCHDRRVADQRGGAKRLWNAGWLASKLDSGICLALAGVLRHWHWLGPGWPAGPAPVPI